MSKFLQVLKALKVNEVKYTSQQPGYKVSVKTTTPTALTRAGIIDAVKGSAGVVTLSATAEDAEEDKVSTGKLIMSGDSGAAQLSIALGMVAVPADSE